LANEQIGDKQMNLKNLDKVWRQNCPEEFNGVARKIKRPERWEIMLDNHNRRKLIASNQDQED
tara:strand:- start:1265 stop:1453 length:189 start_codon:yes stop_codon:yes gene_type:complete